MKVFERARDVTPCCLVFEDLDSLITNENRSAFLNQLDGFASASGMLTLATTNHPDKLDDADMRITGEQIESLVVDTDGFSFAYLKELFLSSMIRWISRKGDRGP